MAGNTLEELSVATCMDLLRMNTVGRVSIVVDDYPVTIPVNYRLVDSRHGPWIVIRTRSGNALDQAGMHVAFQIDNVDPAHNAGWSVLVRGNLTHFDVSAIAPALDRVDPRPWLDGRDSWLAIEPIHVTGRQLHTLDVEWAFHIRGYL
jgi:hypothetical protein